MAGSMQKKTELISGDTWRALLSLRFRREGGTPEHAHSPKNAASVFWVSTLIDKALLAFRRVLTRHVRPHETPWAVSQAARPLGRRWLRHGFVAGLLLLVSAPLSAQMTIVIDPKNADPALRNNAPIQSITYTINGNPVIQNASAGSNTTENVPVFATSITVNPGTGNDTVIFFNDIAAQVRNNNFVSTTGPNLGVYNTVAPTRVTIVDDGLAAFEAAVADASLNNNILNYLFYDGALQNMPNASTADFDLLYYHAFTTDDYLVVGERDGNTFFALVPLGADGEPIPNANTLQFSPSPTPGPGNGHDWNTGYINENDSFDTQPMYFTVASIEKFFEGTSVPVQDQLVYGYRIDNNGNADVKFFGASETTFTDNPINPLLSARIGDFVWSDTNGDGIQGVDEPGINGVIVNLLDSSGDQVFNSQGQPITTVTDDEGFYEFTGVFPGDYQVEFVAPPQYRFTLQDQGPDDGLDSDADPSTGRTAVFTVNAEDDITTLDAGLVEALQITKTSNAGGSLKPGDTLTYTIVVTNNGLGTISGVTVEDQIPAGVTFVTGSISASLDPVPVPGGSFTVDIDTAGAGTFTVPSGATELTVEAWGGGGSGAASGTNDGGGGGGGGAYARVNTLGVTPGDDLNYLVGGGGGLPGPGNPGVAGQASWFSTTSTLFAAGGSGGTISGGGAGGLDGSSIGNQVYAGGSGGSGATGGGNPSTRAGGGGGGSAFANAVGGNGVNGGNNSPGAGGIGEGDGGDGGQANAITAEGGIAPGGGGGGCGGAGAGTGAAGRLRITYDIPDLEGDTGTTPSELASNWTLEPGAILTVTFEVTLNVDIDVDEVTNTASVTSDQHPVPLSDSVTDPVNQPPTAVVLGDIELVETSVSVFLRGLGVDGLDSAGLLAYLGAWDPVAAERLAGADRVALLAALRGYLDPDADGEVVLFRWETLEERGTVGFYVERRASGANWMRVNANLLPAMVAAPMGAEYVLADPGALADIAYDYRLIELEARGTTREYGPFRLQARD